MVKWRPFEDERWCAGSGAPNGTMQSIPAMPYSAPALDESNPAVIWKAIDLSMVPSSSVHACSGMHFSTTNLLMTASWGSVMCVGGLAR